MCAETDVHLAPGQSLLLKEQAGAGLEIAADAERVDALIACGGLGAQIHVLPMVRSCATIDQPDSAGLDNRDEILPSVVVEIRYSEHLRCREAGKRLEIVLFVREPYTGRSRTTRVTSSRDEIDCAVVVEVRGQQSHGRTVESVRLLPDAKRLSIP